MDKAVRSTLSFKDPSSEYDHNQEADYEDEEQYFCNTGSTFRDSTESENSSDNGNDGKYDSPA